MAFDYNKLYWPIWIFVIIYVVLTCVYLGVYVQNVSFTYTWFSNLGAPGATLVSFRNSTASILTRIATLFHVMSVAFVFLLIITRENRALTFVWYSFYALGWFFSLLLLASLGTLYSECNGQGQYGNLFNDPRYCCPIEIQSNVVNGCPNPLPCTNPVVLISELSPNLDAVGLFWLNFVLFMLEFAFLGVMGYFLIFKKELVEEKEEEKEDATAPPPQIVEEKKAEPIPSIPIVGNRAIHGLRRKKN